MRVLQMGFVLIRLLSTDHIVFLQFAEVGDQDFLCGFGRSRRSWPKRSGLILSALMMMGFHFPSITSIAALTGHSESRIASPVTKLCLLDVQS